MQFLSYFLKGGDDPKPKPETKQEEKREDLTFWEKFVKEQGPPAARRGRHARRRCVLRIDDDSPTDKQPRMCLNSPQNTDKEATLGHGSSTTQDNTPDEETGKKEASKISRKRPAVLFSPKTHGHSCPTKRPKRGQVESKGNPNENFADSECSDCGNICGNSKPKKTKKKRKRRKKKKKPCGCC